MAIGLAVVLFLGRVNRASAEADYFGYEHEFYKEDDHRIQVDTDSTHFDIGLGAKVRLTGEVVFDVISGATPNGAPPQSKWPFISFGKLATDAYNSAYTSQFNHYVSQNQIYVDAGLESYHDMTNAAAGFASSTAPTIATNSATSAYNSLTNNPNFRKTTVPLVHMRDFRMAFNLATPITLQNHLLTPSVAFSAESDYVSRGVALNDAISLNNKNTTLSLGWSRNMDIVRDDVFIWQRKISDDFLIGVNQLLGPKSYITADFTYGNEAGYLSDPYRGVMIANSDQSNPNDAALNPEKRPRHRTKQIIYLSWTQFIDPLKGSVEVGYRYFHDSYEINAQTFDLSWHQKIGRKVVVSPSFRYYYQTAANFYYEIVPNISPLPVAYSADYRLSELESFTLGLRVTYRVFRHLSLEAGYMRYVMEGLDGHTSQSAYPSANVVSIGGTIWF